MIAEFMSASSVDLLGNKVEPRYHESWDWLMSVWEKINNTYDHNDNPRFNFIIGPDTCVVFDSLNVAPICENEHGGSNKEMVYETAVQFIEWYNKNEKS